MGSKTDIFERVLVDQLINGSKEAFSTIFRVYYRDLVMFAYTFVKDADDAEEVVQEMFVRLWDKHENLHVQTSLKSWLLKSVQNRCLDEIRHKKIRHKYLDIQAELSLTTNDTENYILYSDLEKQMEAILEQMPENIADTFRLNRFEGLKYQEIADKMGVSLRTVESRISKALQLLHQALKNLYFLFL